MAGAGKGSEKARIEIVPDPRVLEAELKRLGEKTADWSPAFQAALPDVIAGINQNFDTRGASLGQTWEALDPLYSLRKRKAGASKLLELTGLLRATATGRGIKSISKKALVIGTAVPYARAVQYGNPKRRFLAWSASMNAKAMGHMQARADELLREIQDRTTAAGVV